MAHIRHIFSSFHIRSDDRQDTFKSNNNVKFETQLNHAYHLEPHSYYFIQLNSISLKATSHLTETEDIPKNTCILSA